MGSVSSHTQAADARAERVSALIDSQSLGEVDQFMFELNAGDRATWSSYHLVGDVLRSDDLADGASEGDGFMARFSARLAAEPHLLAPGSLARPTADGASGQAYGEPAQANGAAPFGVRRRVAPAFAIAAAAAVLSWVVLPQLQHPGNPATAGVSLAAQSAVTGPSPDVRTVSVAASPAQSAPAQPNVIRDAALDQYLEAHMQFASHPGDNGAPYVRSALYSAGAN